MSPGATMTRVYEAPKSQVMAGAFRPGERLEPSRLAQDLASSPTPVRDALHRLTGERLIDSWLHDGFRQPLVLEPAVRDLYAWANDLMGIVVNAIQSSPVGPERDEAVFRWQYERRLADLFASVVSLSPNHEHRIAIASLNDRLALYRQAEEQVLDGVAEDLDRIERLVAKGDWGLLIQALSRFHEKRIRNADKIATHLRR